MIKIPQQQERDAFPTSAAGNGSKSHNAKGCVGKPIKTKASILKSTGPRTAQGKERSKLNALKNGLFSKAVLLKGESRAEYLSLLNGLRDDLRPEGTLEAGLVENLAALFWRKRRLFQAENAEVSERMEYARLEFVERQHAEARDLKRDAIKSGGLLNYTLNRFVVQEAKEIVELFREVFNVRGFSVDPGLLTKLYGVDLDHQQGRSPYGLRRLYDAFAATCVKLAKEPGDDKSEESKVKQIMLAAIDSEIKRLAALENCLEIADMQRGRYKASAAIIPGQETSERLLRYETHFGREIDRILNQLERLQKMRKGEPVPPTLNVKVST